MVQFSSITYLFPATHSPLFPILYSILNPSVSSTLFSENSITAFFSWRNKALGINENSKHGHYASFSFDAAFDEITDIAKKERIIVAIDEFPYLADSDPSLLSVMQHLIDHRLINTKLYLILCGSYMGFMEKNVLGEKSPIFGRRTGQLHLKPMNYIASAGFLDGFSLEEKALLYGVYGGTPMYLQQADSNKSIK